MPSFTLLLEIDPKSLQELHEANEKLVLAKAPVVLGEWGSGPTVVWAAFEPFENNSVTWEEEYAIYASNQAAGVWPHTTTHFVEDAFAGGHCDPRCFDLQHFYDIIAGLVGHAAGSTYGVTPSYGMKSGTNTVWWHDTVCHGPHP
jgi:hypothetical protein